MGLLHEVQTGSCNGLDIQQFDANIGIYIYLGAVDEPADFVA